MEGLSKIKILIDTDKSMVITRGGEELREVEEGKEGINGIERLWAMNTQYNIQMMYCRIVNL